MRRTGRTEQGVSPDVVGTIWDYLDTRSHGAMSNVERGFSHQFTECPTTKLIVKKQEYQDKKTGFDRYTRPQNRNL